MIGPVAFALSVVGLGVVGLGLLITYLLLSDTTDPGIASAQDHRAEPVASPHPGSAATVAPDAEDPPTQRLDRLDTALIHPSSWTRRFVRHQPEDAGKHHRRREAE